jgi:hypothetical protein
MLALAVACVPVRARATVAESMPCGGVVDVTLPRIVGPLLATNPTEAVGTAVLVAVTVCTPGVEANVHVTLSRPAASVVPVAAETLPPPVTVQVMAAPATGRFAPSSISTTRGLGSTADTAPICAESGDTRARWFAVFGMGVLDDSPLQPPNTTSVATAADASLPKKRRDIGGPFEA